MAYDPSNFPRSRISNHTTIYASCHLRRPVRAGHRLPRRACRRVVWAAARFEHIQTGQDRPGSSYISLAQRCGLRSRDLARLAGPRRLFDQAGAAVGASSGVIDKRRGHQTRERFLTPFPPGGVFRLVKGNKQRSASPPGPACIGGLFGIPCRLARKHNRPPWQRPPFSHYTVAYQANSRTENQKNGSPKSTENAVRCFLTGPFFILWFLCLCKVLFCLGLRALCLVDAALR